MRVANLLSTKGRDVTTIDESGTVAEAVALLKEHRIGALVVTGEGSPLAGILSERDVVRALAERGAAILDERVADLMTAEVTTCTEATTVTDLMGLMTAHRIRHVPVVADGVLIGMVSIGDVVKARFEELEGEKRDLLDYVSAR
ncbi:MAG TPA: CBS domain-containing protein [Acidimicrobiales bacterium]|nr:CBS domain-containing protein [Acidimicrobiales bacterium]